MSIQVVPYVSTTHGNKQINWICADFLKDMKIAGNASKKTPPTKCEIEHGSPACTKK